MKMPAVLLITPRRMWQWTTNYIRGTQIVLLCNEDPCVLASRNNENAGYVLKFTMADTDRKSVELSNVQYAEHLTSPQHTNTSHAMPPPSSSSVPRPASTHVAPHSLITPLTPVTGDPGLVPTLQNVVSTVNLACPLDLMKINFRTRNSEYNPSRFSGIVMRIREPHTTALLFKSGKMVITGARNEDDSRLAARKYARIIQKLGFPVKFLDFKIQNIVGTCDLRFPIRVECLNQMHGQFSSYEPELFPGLIYRMVKPRVVLLIFVNGKLVMTGARTREDLQEALDNIYPILKSFKKQ